jgi:hypothetical protein
MTNREQRVWDIAFVANVMEAQAFAVDCDTTYSDEELARDASDEADHMLKIFRLAMEERDE